MKLRHLIPIAIACATACFATEQATNSAPSAPASAPAAPAFHVHVLPPGAYERLNLTPDQAKAVAALEVQATASLQAILTADQLQQLKQMHRGRGPGGPGGQGQGNGMPPPPPPGQ